MKQVTLSKKDLKDLNKDIGKKYGVDDFYKRTDFVTIADDIYILKDGNIEFFYRNEELIPALSLILRNGFLKTVQINMGAVPFIAKGADLMRPGIVGVDAYVKEGDFVAIVDENNLRPIAIGQTLFSKDEMQDMETGKMVLNLHYVGDDVWKLKLAN